jgi:hypothetical protein
VRPAPHWPSTGERLGHMAAHVMPPDRVADPRNKIPVFCHPVATFEKIPEFLTSGEALQNLMKVLKNELVFNPIKQISWI